MDDPRIRPGRIWYWVALGIFLVGVGGGTAWLLYEVTSPGPPRIQFPAPGGIQIDIAHPGRYQIWNDAARILSPSNTLALLPEDIRVTVTDLTHNRPLAVAIPRGVREDNRSVIRYRIALFDITEPATLEVRIDGDFSGRPVSVQELVTWRQWAAMGAGLLLCVVGWIASPIIVYVVYTRRLIARREIYGSLF